MRDLVAVFCGMLWAWFLIWVIRVALPSDPEGEPKDMPDPNPLEKPFREEIHDMAAKQLRHVRDQNGTDQTTTR